MTGVRFDAEAIRALAHILRDTDLTEIELVEGDSRVRVARTPPAPAPVQMAYPQGAPAVAATAVPPPAPPPAPLTEAQAADAGLEGHPGLVASPMVGVAYLAPEPGAAPFVTVGGKVAQGQTVLLIEAMKTFNQIKAHRAGTVTRILIEGGMPVEYGEPLLLIE